MPKSKGNLALIYKNGFPLILESGCPVINWVFGKFGNENEILLAGIAPHAMVLGNLSSLRPAFVLALTVRFHLTCKSCTCTCACACVASENQA